MLTIMNNASLYFESWPRISVHRADIYAFFSDLFAYELTSEKIKFYQKGEYQPLFESLSNMGFEREVNLINQSVSDFSSFDDIRLELAADFTQLFLLDGAHSALPYASHYLESNQQLLGAIESKMQQFLRDSSLTIHKEFSEPADHISVYFALLERWIKQEQSTDHTNILQAAEDQCTFIVEGLLSWLPQFVERTQKIVAVSRFYPAMVALMFAFICEDRRYLTENQ